MGCWIWSKILSLKVQQTLELSRKEKYSSAVLSSIHFINHIFQAASNKAEESFTKLSDSEAQAVQGRVDVISYACQAEINHFNQNRVGDFKVMMQKYLQGQISFYQNVSDQLLVLFDTVYVTIWVKGILS